MNTEKFLIKIRIFFVNMFRRIAFLIATVVIWPIYIITTMIYTPLLYLVLLIVMPVLWVILGSGKMFKSIYFFLFYRKNKKLWYEDYDADYEDEKFFSAVPIWAKYLQKNYLDKILPENERD